MRSSTSTVRGRKSTSRRLPAVAVQRTIVSPWRTTTAPEACLAILPVSNEISLPAISTETRVTASDIFISLLCRTRRSAGRSLDPIEPDEVSGRGTGLRRRTKVGVVATPARTPPSKSRRMRASVASDRRSASKRSRSSPSRSRTRPQVRVLEAAPGRRRARRASPRSGPAARRPPRPPPAAPGARVARAHREVPEDDAPHERVEPDAAAPRSAGTRSRRSRSAAPRPAGRGRGRSGRGAEPARCADQS